MQPQDLFGKRFGRLTAIKISTKPGRRRWLCACDCGGYTTTLTHLLLSGHTQSCGCLKRERAAVSLRKTATKHGGSDTPEWFSWTGMRSRCLNPNATGYERYGGAGVRIDPRWADFGNFRADMGPRPTPAHTLDRIDKRGDYTPSNCRWATKFEQANNRRDNCMVVIDGRSLSVSTACREHGSIVTRGQAWRRIQAGWDVVRAVSTPPR